MSFSKRVSLLVLTAFPAIGLAQSASYTIGQAVRDATEKYPATAAAIEQVSAAAAAIRLARTSYLPRADFLAQANRATRNNVFGMILPQPTLPGISGPVLGTNTSGSAWGSAIGFQVAWEQGDGPGP